MKFLQNLKIDLAGVDVPLTQLSSAILQRILNGEKGGKNCDSENSEVFQLVGLQMSEMRIAFVLRNLKFYSSGLLPTSRFAFCFSFMEIIDSP